MAALSASQMPMLNLARAPHLALLALAIAVAGCGKPSNSPAGSDRREAPITGKPTDAPVPIAAAWQAGKKYALRLERTQTSLFGTAVGRRVNPGASNSTVETTYAQEYSLLVTNSAGGARGAEMEITGIELIAARGEETLINYDSQNKVVPRGQSDPISTAVVSALDKLVGGKVRYQLSPEGKVQKVEGLNELFARVDGTNTQRGPFSPSTFLRRAISEDTFKQMVEFHGLPEKERRIGESWAMSRQLEAPMVGKLGMEITNTLRGWQEHEGVKCARVEFTGTVASLGTAAGPRGGRIAVRDGQVSGHFWYDPAIGLSRELRMNQSYTVTASGFGGRGGNPAAATNTFTAPVNETLSVKLLEVHAQEL